MTGCAGLLLTTEVVVVVDPGGAVVVVLDRTVVDVAEVVLVEAGAVVVVEAGAVVVVGLVVVVWALALVRPTPTRALTEAAAKSAPALILVLPTEFSLSAYTTHRLSHEAITAAGVDTLPSPDW